MTPPVKSEGTPVATAGPDSDAARSGATTPTIDNALPAVKGNPNDDEPDFASAEPADEQQALDIGRRMAAMLLSAQGSAPARVNAATWWSVHDKIVLEEKGQSRRVLLVGNRQARETGAQVFWLYSAAPWVDRIKRLNGSENTSITPPSPMTRSNPRATAKGGTVVLRTGCRDGRPDAH